MPDADSRAKRASSIGIDLAWLHVYPNPDGTIDVFDRQQTAYKYSGISAGTGTVVVSVTPYRMLMGIGA